MGKSTISMAIFNSYVSWAEGIYIYMPTNCFDDGTGWGWSKEVGNDINQPIALGHQTAVPQGWALRTKSWDEGNILKNNGKTQGFK